MLRQAIAVAFGLGLAVAGITQDAPSAGIPAKPAGWKSAPSGTGRWPAVAEVRADLPGYTVYHPATLPNAALPLVVWGNGACRDNGLGHAQFLREIASHGYYVVSLGYARAERAVERGLKIPANLPPPTRIDDETHVEQMTAAMDWAQHPPADLKGHVDAKRIAVMGHSCGGLQAITVSADPRITTSLIFDSGVYIKPLPTNRSGVHVTKDDLAKIHGPIAYFIGGPTDIAYANAMDDFARLKGPRFLGQLPIGHMGTFWEDANGGEWARAASAWLDWQLKGDAKAAAAFRGPDCRLCHAPGWSVDNSKLQ